jgi:hypothetical protein
MRKLISRLALVGMGGLLAAGCVAHASVGGSADANAPVAFKERPTLVEIDRDVWVVREHGQAVYYVNGFYWVNRDNVWWRAQSYDRGWGQVEASTVPPAIAQRDHREYVNYRGTDAARTRPAPQESLASGADPDRGPPEHAGGKHGGPPGQDAVPGVGNQRKAEDGHPGLGNSDDKKNTDSKADGKPGNDNKPANDNKPDAKPGNENKPDNKPANDSKPANKPGPKKK